MLCERGHRRFGETGASAALEPGPCHFGVGAMPLWGNRGRRRFGKGASTALATLGPPLHWGPWCFRETKAFAALGQEP